MSRTGTDYGRRQEEKFLTDDNTKNKDQALLNLKCVVIFVALR